MARDHTVIGMPFGDPAEVRMKDLRIAFFTDNGIVPAEPETIAVVQQAAAALEPEVNRIEERRPPGVEESYELEMRMIGPDGGDGLRAFLTAIGSTRTHPLLEGWLTKLEPYRTTIDGFAEYWAALDRFRARMFAFLEDYDAIISPVFPQAALPHGSFDRRADLPGIQLHHDPQSYRLARRRGALRSDGRRPADRCADRRPSMARRCGASDCSAPRVRVRRMATQPVPLILDPVAAYDRIGAGVRAHRRKAQSVFGQHRSAGDLRDTSGKPLHARRRIG